MFHRSILLIACACLLAGCETRKHPPTRAPVQKKGTGQPTTLRRPLVTRADPADVSTVADIIRVSYEVINGPPGAPRQWERDSTLYMPGATFVSVEEEKGAVQTKIMTPEEFRRNFRIGTGCFQTEVGSRIERYGQLAQVRSVAVFRSKPNGPVEGRWVNYFQLYWDGYRWWIAGMIWEKERPSVPIPEAWIGHWEEISQ